MKEFFRSFRKYSLNKISIHEKDCYQALSYEDLLQQVRSLQLEKRKYLTLYLESLEKRLKSSDSKENRTQFENIQVFYWRKHIHFESLISKCLYEAENKKEKHIYF